MPLGSRMGLGVEPEPFLVQTPEGSVEAPREGARDGTLDAGAEEDKASVCGTAEGVDEDAGRDRCVSSSRAVPGCSNMPAGGDSVGWMGSRRRSWTRARLLPGGLLTWLVCGTATLPETSTKTVTLPESVGGGGWGPHLVGALALFFISAASFMAFSHVFMSSWVSALKK